MLVTQDLPRQVERLGENTAFFGTECIMQNPIISQTIATGALFVNTCCPSPYHGYPEALEIENRVPTGQYNSSGNPITRRLNNQELLMALDEAVDSVGMSGRISAWAVPDSVMWTAIGFMYALEWLDGNVPQESGVIDIEVLERLASEYMAQLAVDASISLEHLTLEGETIGHHILGTIDYHVFGNQ
jgi:hypothetical protein